MTLEELKVYIDVKLKVLLDSYKTDFDYLWKTISENNLQKMRDDITELQKKVK
jgi:hypothetical protein